MTNEDRARRRAEGYYCGGHGGALVSGWLCSVDLPERLHVAWRIARHLWASDLQRGVWPAGDEFPERWLV